MFVGVFISHIQLLLNIWTIQSTHLLCIPKSGWWRLMKLAQSTPGMLDICKMPPRARVKNLNHNVHVEIIDSEYIVVLFYC